MKKVMILLLSLTLVLSLTACGSGAALKEVFPPVPSPSPVIPIQPEETMPSAAPEPEPEETAETVSDPMEVLPEETAEAVSGPKEALPAESIDSGVVDVDLTQLSSTMVYSEVYAMVYEPEKYIGKTVKMHGLFATQEYDDERFYACIVQDATACCAQGLEFELAEELVYPDDYPEPGTEITVVGTFDSYKEEVNGNYYLYLVLRNAHFA